MPSMNQEDVEKALYSVLAHRMRLKPSVRYLKKPEDIIKEELDNFKTEKSDSGDIP